MKTILQALKDEIYYPLNTGIVENKLIGRGLNPDETFSKAVLDSSEWKGALADSLITLIQAVNVSEGDKSFGALTDKQRTAILKWANRLYGEIGEEEVILEEKPLVSINPESWM